MGGGIERCFCLTSDVCLTSLAFIGPNSRTQKSRKTKLAQRSPTSHVTRTSENDIGNNLRGCGQDRVFTFKYSDPSLTFERMALIMLHTNRYVKLFFSGWKIKLQSNSVDPLLQRWEVRGWVPKNIQHRTLSSDVDLLSNLRGSRSVSMPTKIRFRFRRRKLAIWSFSAFFRFCPKLNFYFRFIFRFRSKNVICVGPKMLCSQLISN